MVDAMLHALCPLRSFVRRANFFRDDTKCYDVQHYYFGNI